MTDSLPMDSETTYKQRLNKVFSFIAENLDSDLSLNNVSAIAHFSPFHFHRIFKSITGETLNDYVVRKRIEKSAQSLLHTSASINDIALRHGFSDNTSFSRSFKNFYGISPAAFRKENTQRHSKIRQAYSKNGQVYPDTSQYLRAIDNLKKWITMSAKIEVTEIPTMELAYVTCIGPANIPAAYQKLIRWATPKGLMSESTKMMTIYHDSFKFTEPDKVRMSACMIVKEKIMPEGEIGSKALEQGRVIKGSFEISPSDFEKSWTGMFMWMNDNGYTKSDREPFEIYHNNWSEHPEKKAIVDFYVPVK